MRRTCSSCGGNDNRVGIAGINLEIAAAVRASELDPIGRILLESSVADALDTKNVVMSVARIRMAGSLGCVGQGADIERRDSAREAIAALFDA